MKKERALPVRAAGIFTAGMLATEGAADIPMAEIETVITGFKEYAQPVKVKPI